MREPSRSVGIGRADVIRKLALACRCSAGIHSSLSGLPRCADAQLAKTFPMTMLVARD